MRVNNRKVYSRRSMRGIKAKRRVWANIVNREGFPLSSILKIVAAPPNQEQVFLCGSLAQMSREYVEEPLGEWEFAVPYVHKHRAPIYRRKSDGVEIVVKLASHKEGWFPGCEENMVAQEAWKALAAEWQSETDIPLLSTPSKTGQALLWENLPKGHRFPALPADVENVIRANSTQHRKEVFKATIRSIETDEILSPNVIQYDGRWMYAALSTLDRLPVGEPRRVGYFNPYEPGWH